MDDFSKEKLIEGPPTFIGISQYIYKAFNRFLSDDIECLYHYTNLDGLLGIIGSRGFWATHIKFMNDSKEYLHGLSICFKIIDELKKDVNENERKFLSSVGDSLDKDGSEDFVISFCPNGDLLSQWRGYSRGEYGMSIGFNYKKLFSFTTPRDNEYIFPQKVIYDPSIQRDIVKEVLDIGLKNVKNSGLDLDFIPNQFARALKTLIPLFKDSSFSEEQEWRIVTTNYKESNGGHKVYFRVRENGILPFVKLPLREQMKDDKVNLPIDRIIVGPSGSSKLTTESIEYFLKNKEYVETKVSKSQIPYR
ncbi:DUF2971 domain-containing protein [Halobacillus sp. HZG1]|uniref:DUF2971 domain-containing protein n=1 Tax=Halobacillus sp. HZG1 TaxID=3111769 RepID=UPI002DB7A435|nr:DUF2971 domain-containing protein [Halobacillus sp. HZG1]MEC3885512.1 DUF2971 domain-containing protein [Halobacillus sp. HZG1]